MNQTLIKNINIWTMDERDSRFFGWILLETAEIASMGEGKRRTAKASLTARAAC